MGNTESLPTETEPLTALRLMARSTTHDAKNAVGLIWLHLASLERKVGPTAEAETREAIDGLKEETRQIVRLLDALSDQAKR
jgi:hypothetical protein